MILNPDKATKAGEAPKVERSKAKKVAGVVLFAAAAASFFFFTRDYGLGFPVTPSVGDNVFLLEKTRRDYHKGGMVSFYYRGKPFLDYKNGTRFLKYVKCVPGDTLEVKDRQYYCNGQYLGEAFAVDRFGRTLNNFLYNGKVPEGHLFVMGDHPKSYDSRYWGFVSEKDIYAIATAIF